VAWTPRRTESPRSTASTRSRRPSMIEPAGTNIIGNRDFGVGREHFQWTCAALRENRARCQPMKFAWAETGTIASALRRVLHANAMMRKQKQGHATYRLADFIRDRRAPESGPSLPDSVSTPRASLVHNNLALHLLMTQTTMVAAPKRVRAGRLREKFNCGCFSLFKLPAVLRRRQN